MEIIKALENSWDQERKDELVALGQSAKPYSEIVTYLENEISNSKRMSTFKHVISCFKNDGIYQLHRAIEWKMGAASVAVERRGPSRPDVAMETIEVILANGIRKKVPYGRIELPNMGEDAYIDIAYSNTEKSLIVSGECQFKFQTLVDEIIEKTKVLLNTDSIYKSQAIEIRADHDKGQPQILNLKNIDKEHMIISADVEYALSPLNVRIMHPEKCKKNGIPMKFGALLEGPYGLCLQ